MEELEDSKNALLTELQKELGQKEIAYEKLAQDFVRSIHVIIYIKFTVIFMLKFKGFTLVFNIYFKEISLLNSQQLG